LDIVNIRGEREGRRVGGRLAGRPGGGRQGARLGLVKRVGWAKLYLYL